MNIDKKIEALEELMHMAMDNMLALEKRVNEMERRCPIRKEEEQERMRVEEYESQEVYG